MTITLKDTKKSIYIINNDKTTGDISSIVIPHDFSIGVNGLEKRLVVYGTARFESDVQIIGTLYGGSPVKIAGGIKVEGGAQFDGVDVVERIEDVPVIKTRVDSIELEYMKPDSFDNKISESLALKDSSISTALNSLQPKSAMSSYTKTVDLDTTITDLSNNKTTSFSTKLSTLQTKSAMSSYTKTSNLDTAISSLLSDSSTASGAKIDLLQTKADLKTSVESLTSFISLQNDVEDTKSDISTLSSTLDSSAFKSGITPVLISDKNLKKNIKLINNPFEIINKLKPVTFKWNEKAIDLLCYDEYEHYGFIAQDIKEVLPSIVNEQDKNGNLSIRTNNFELISILISSVQKQQEQIKELNTRILELEKRNN